MESEFHIAVVDDDPAVCDALALRFFSEGWRVSSYHSAPAFLHARDGLTLDCVLLDVHLPLISGLEVLAAIGGPRSPAPVIMISGQGDIATAVAAVKAGAHDFVQKPFDGEVLMERIRKAVAARATAAERPPRRRHFPGAERLTAREKDVLDAVAHGLSNKEAGRILGISPRTVEIHRARVMEKLGARNTADLMRIVLA